MRSLILALLLTGCAVKPVDPAPELPQVMCINPPPTLLEKAQTLGELFSIGFTIGAMFL